MKGKCGNLDFGGGRKVLGFPYISRFLFINAYELQELDLSLVKSNSTSFSSNNIFLVANNNKVSKLGDKWVLLNFFRK